jgi:hypothetical protein
MRKGLATTVCLKAARDGGEEYQNRMMSGDLNCNSCVIFARSGITLRDAAMDPCLCRSQHRVPTQNRVERCPLPVSRMFTGFAELSAFRGGSPRAVVQLSPGPP